jgi:hypothetical protein
VLQKNEKDITSLLVFGFLAVGYGMSIYYLLPLALLSFNVGLVVNMFFAILMGMLFGLALFALNF